MDDQLRHDKAKLEYEIDPWDLNEARERGDTILVVDTRTSDVYRRGHIPGAINIPHRAMSTATTA
jgi:rhodanese-related sulfurtransferase